MKHHQTGCLWLVLIILISACSSMSQDTTLPTVAILPSATITPTPVPTRAVRQIENNLPPTWTFTPSPTITLTSKATSTSLPTWTPQPSTTYTATATETPSSDAYVSNEAGVHVRTGPSTRFNPPLETLDQNDPINFVAISLERDWLKVQTASGQIGWVFLELITLNRELPPDLPEEIIPTPTASAEPIVQVQVTPGEPIVLGVGGVAPLDTNTSTGTTSSSGLANIISVSNRTRQIYQTGLSKGNNPRVFAKVGDSITNNQPFMNGYGTQEYDLGGYGYLQASIDFFDNGSFVRDSLAAESGFNAAAVLDAIWAPSGTCFANESPLACEYRIMKPSIAVIMYGSVDVQLYGADAFQGYLNQIVQSTISRGIIPVLMTFPNGADYYPSQAEQFNSVIRGIASAEQIPLIEFRNPALNLPDRGVGGDKFHLSMNGTSYYIALTGDHNLYGLTLRNLLTLQALDDLRRELGMG
jgi:hypothetical protein